MHTMKRINKWLALSLAGLFTFTSLQIITLQTAVAAGARGGSNDNFYALDGCNREPYGVVNSYHLAPATINAQLAQMHQNGQDRLIIGIFHRHGPDSGTIMDSTGGNLSLQNRQNLTNLLTSVKQAGFVEIAINFHPVDMNNPSSWTSWDEGLYQENWNLIHNLRPIIQQAGIPYRIDLMNEGIPSINQPVLLQYTQRLWGDYTYTHGKDDTFGFSVIGSESARVNRIKEVYGPNPPYVFNFHFYGTPQASEYSQFVNAHNKLNSFGYKTQGIVVGETFYNDSLAAYYLQRASNDTKRTIHYLAQWPLTRAKVCAEVDIAPPTNFNNFITRGF